MKLVLEIKGDKIPKENDVLVFDEEKECSVIEVQTVEYTKGTNELTIFDFNDNTGKITMVSSYEAESTIRKIGSATGPVKIQGHLSWD